jgi:hypothetical protein
MDSVKHDQQKLKQMIDSINVFETQDSDLAKLISNLETLFESLEHVSEEWRSAFLSKWGVLEEVYASALDEGINELGDEDTRLITEALDSIRDLISSNTSESFNEA